MINKRIKKKKKELSLIFLSFCPDIKIPDKIFIGKELGLLFLFYALDIIVVILSVNHYQLL